MASAAAAIPVDDGKYDPDFTQAILDLNNDYNEVVRRSGGRALPPEELFNLFMIISRYVRKRKFIERIRFERGRYRI